MEGKPRKRNFIQRAHSNPFSDKNILIPKNPGSIDWSEYYAIKKAPQILDLGCGYGKFLISLSSKFPKMNILGMEIRGKVAKYVQENIECLRNSGTDEILNVACIHTNGMLFVQNFFDKSSLNKIFILFPDPHFKKRKHKARIVCKEMLDIYEYLLEDSGMIYISTDVESLFLHMDDCLKLHPGFIKVEGDPLEKSIVLETDEAIRAGVKTGVTFASVYMKIERE